MPFISHQHCRMGLVIHQMIVMTLPVTVSALDVSALRDMSIMEYYYIVQVRRCLSPLNDDKLLPHLKEPYLIEVFEKSSLTGKKF